MNDLERLLHRAASAFALPPPTQIQCVHRAAVDTYAVQFAEGDPVWIRVARAARGRQALLTEKSALAALWAQGTEAVPEAYRVIEVDRVPIAVHAALQGDYGVHLLGGADTTAITRSTGEWIATLPKLPTHGAVGDGNTFRPCTPDWSTQLHHELAQCRRVLADTGLGLGAVETDLAARIPEGITTDDYALIHRDLAPDRFTWADQQITGVYGWERAWVGDPLYQWAGLVLQPVDLLAGAVRGARAYALYDKDNLERIQAYTALEILARLADRARTLSPRNHATLARFQMLAAHEASQLDGLGAHLENASKHDGPVQWPGWEPDPHEAMLHRLLRLLGERDRLLPDLLEQAIAAALLAEITESPAWLEAATEVAERLETPWRGAFAPYEVSPPAPTTGETHWGARGAMLYQLAMQRLPHLDPAAKAGIAGRLHVLASRDQPIGGTPVMRAEHALYATLQTPDGPAASQLSELYDLCKGFERETPPNWSELAAVVSLPRAPALIAAHLLREVDLAVRPEQVVTLLEA